MEENESVLYDVLHNMESQTLRLDVQARNLGIYLDDENEKSHLAEATANYQRALAALKAAIVALGGENA